MKNILTTENSNNILLSISIITYNQPNEVKRALESLFFQITDEVEIIVNDNSDNSDTKNLIEKDFPNVRYFKNEDERIIDTNILNAINRSNGEYIWFFGDDEFEPTAINNILKIIKENKYNFIFTNFYINEQTTNNPAVILNSDEIIDNGSDVLEKVANALGFLSSVIIRKECLLSLDKKKMKKFIGCGFTNFYITLHSLSLPGLFYLCSYPYVHAFAVLADNMTEKYKNDAFRSFVVDTPDILNSFKDKFHKKSVKKLLLKSFGHIWRGMIVGIVNNGKIQKGHFKLICEYYWNFPEFWIALPFFLMPRFISVFFYKLYKKITSHNKYLKQKLSKVPWF